MKKYLASMLLSAAAIVSATMLVSCGDDDNNGVTPEKPVEEVVMGRYNFHFNSIKIGNWPDKDSGIEDRYAAYQKDIIAALNIDLNKKYDWSVIEADKDRLAKEFDKLGDFEYKVKSVTNYMKYYGDDITFGAIKDGSDKMNPTIGEKKIKCIMDVPENVTTQLHIEMSSFVPMVPSAKEYCDKVRALYTEALKEEFTGEYGTEEKGVSRKESFYYNMKNYTTDSLEVKNRVNKICQEVKIPAVPDDVKKDVQAVSPALPYLFKIWINKYDPNATFPIKSEVEVYYRGIKAE